jgi:molybdopterin/thiamine biosynthesis adenylyltransferase
MASRLPLNNLVVRRATPGDSRQLAALFQTVYVNSSHPFQSETDVERFIADERNFEVVVEVDGRIIAGAAMAYMAWNDSYELGRAITHSDFRRHALAGFLMENVVREVCARSLGSVFFGFPRVRRIADLSAVIEPPFVVIGHDGGRNIAGGQREVHLIVYSVPRHAQFHHIAPSVPGLLKSRFLRSNVYRPLSLSISPGEYPPECFVGSVDERSERKHGFIFERQMLAANGAIEILGQDGVASPRAIESNLEKLVAEFPNVEHVTVNALADKADLIVRLGNCGFYIAAYLPAWYESNGRRFDCVQLVRESFKMAPLIQGFEEIFATLRSKLPRLFLPEGERARHKRLRQSPIESGVLSDAELSWRPILYRWENEEERRQCMELIKEKPSIVTFDTLLSQLQNLVRSRQPGRKMSQEEVELAVREHLAGRAIDEYGVWVYYSWAGRLVHLLDEHEFIDLRTNRNRYKITPQEQAELRKKKVGVVGLSVGQSVAVTLALERGCGELRLADFDTLDLSNLNRMRSGLHNLLLPKVIITAREIAEFDPYLAVSIFEEGLKRENIDNFFAGGGHLDVIVDECDSLDVKCLIREEARRRRIAVVMETSDRGMLDIERFDLSADLPPFHGLAGNFDPEAMSNLTTEQKVPFVLRILGQDTISPRLRASMVEIDETISTWPQLASAISLGGGIAAEAVRRILLNDVAPSGRYFVDLDAIMRPRAPSSLPPVAPITPADLIVPPDISPSASTAALPDSVLKSFVEQACLAPSGGNSQPWRWFAENSNLHLFLNRERSSGLIDHGFRGSYLALGAAAENLRLSAQAEGFQILIRFFSSAATPDHVATFNFYRAPMPGAEDHWRSELSRQIPRRHTNRRLGKREAISDAVLEELTEAVQSIPGTDVVWLTANDEITLVGSLVGRADRIRILHPQLHREMFAEIRWSREEVETRNDGIDVESLHLSAIDYAGLQICSDPAAINLVHQWDLGRKLERLSERYVQSSAAVGMIATRMARPQDYFNGGRAIQRMWLAATEKDLAVHPMTALPYLMSMLDPAVSAIDARTAAQIDSLRPDYQKLFGPTDALCGIFLFRISFAASTEQRSLRRPIEEVLKFQPSTHAASQ